MSSVLFDDGVTTSKFFVIIFISIILVFLCIELQHFGNVNYVHLEVAEYKDIYILYWYPGKSYCHTLDRSAKGPNRVGISLYPLHLKMSIVLISKVLWFLFYKNINVSASLIRKSTLDRLYSVIYMVVV